ncbi:hypothetical protein ACFOET_00915 [Parapedobacter deserti]|uniref:Right handed beta helix domain-containing protein n=1 Tax=Parapedobacter deserti TaxID=1912957 RepID=A0ABV7JGD6_9SPHI
MLIPSPIPSDAGKGDSTDSGNDGKNDSPPPSQQRIVLAADDKGRLTIDGEKQAFDCKTTIAIAAGKYSLISIRNLKGIDGCPVRITNDGLVELAGYRAALTINNVSNVVISGDGHRNYDKGFLFRDNDYRAVELSGDINDFTFQYAEFRDIRDYVISYNRQKLYDGSAATYSKKLTFSHLKVERCGAFVNFPGGISGTDIKGLIRGLEISFVEISNCPNPRNVVHVGLVEDYDIHDNVLSNINMENNNHNAMFHLVGNGKFYNNHISNHQGNAIRAWAVSMGSTPKEIQIFNNIVVNSRKYSAFETQSFERYLIPNKTTFANAKIFHNTCSKLNTSKDWYGVVVDAYRLFGGKLEVFNNLAFDLPSPHPKSHIVSYMSIEDGKLNETNNRYFATASAAGIVNETNFKLSTKSEAYKNGAPNFLTFDFYGTQRNTSSPSIGAVER